MGKFNGFFDNFSKALGNPKGNLGDWRHAAATFVRNNMRLSPKSGFLYHVSIDVNQTALATLGYNILNLLGSREFNLLVTDCTLPRFTVSYQKKNMYNRKKIVKTAVEHEPISMTFWDDQAGLTTLLWEAYYRYYSQDPNYADVDGAGQPDTGTPVPYQVGPYDPSEVHVFRYGLDRARPTLAPFFNSITVNQFHTTDQKSKFTSFTLINPVIADMSHAQLSYSDGAPGLKNSMRFDSEAIMYGRGFTDQDNPSTFADPAHYDVTPSPLSIEGGGTATLFGNGGVADGFIKVFRDIEAGNFNLGTILTAINTYRNAEELSSEGLRQEGYEILEGGLSVLAAAAVNGINNILVPNQNTGQNLTNSSISQNSNSFSTVSMGDLRNAASANPAVATALQKKALRDQNPNLSLSQIDSLQSNLTQTQKEAFTEIGLSLVERQR